MAFSCTVLSTMMRSNSVGLMVWQYFSGLDYYEPRLPCDATQIGRFRSAIGEAGMQVILKATIDLLDVRSEFSSANNFCPT